MAPKQEHRDFSGTNWNEVLESSHGWFDNSFPFLSCWPPILPYYSLPAPFLRSHRGYKFIDSDASTSATLRRTNLTFPHARLQIQETGEKNDSVLLRNMLLENSTLAKRVGLFWTTWQLAACQFDLMNQGHPADVPHRWGMKDYYYMCWTQRT